jgi:hypothetical protein
MILFQAGSRTLDIELTTLSSTNHVELSPSDAGFQDRYVVQEIIKEIAKNRPIDTKGKRGFKGNAERIYIFFSFSFSDLCQLILNKSNFFKDYNHQPSFSPICLLIFVECIREDFNNVFEACESLFSPFYLLISPALFFLPLLAVARVGASC